MSTLISYVPFAVNDTIYFNKTLRVQLAQTFSGNDEFELTDVDIYITEGFITVDSGDVTVGIYATSGGVPTGTALSSGTISSSSLYPSGWKNVTMSVYTIAASTTYALVLTPDFSNTPEGHPGYWAGWGGTQTGGYISGSPFLYTTVWAEAEIGDFAFKINGTAEVGYADVTGTISGLGAITGTVYLTETPEESFAPPTPNAFNMISPTRRLVALAKNSFYYEDI
jgi:hypothetical protein